MKLNFFLLKIIIFFSVFSFSCQIKPYNSNQSNISSSNSNTSQNVPQAMNMNAETPAEVAVFKVEMSANPSQVVANKETELTFTIKDKDGAQVKNFQVVHEKKMHLIAVSADLSEFEHLHPELQSDGNFKLKYTFKHGGKFILFSDVTPDNGSQTVERFELDVKGDARPAEKLIADNSLTKQMDGISVTMKPDGELTSNKESALNFVITDDATGKPVTDLQNYLGELAHIVIISEDTKDYLHVHPMSNKKAGETSVMAHTNFPRGGIYKLWIQFQRNNKIIAIPYILNVTKGAEKSKTSFQTDNVSIKIEVKDEGYSPATISIQKGKPIKLIFLREDDKNCGDEVVFPMLNIKKSLPVGQEVAVEINPTENGAK